VPCRTIRIRMGQRFERIIRVTFVVNISLRVSEDGDGTRDIRYVDSKDFFDNLDFDKEIEGAGTRGS
jgi:hypothetical protein